MTPAAPPASGPQEEATPGQAAHRHFGQARCSCPPSCECHEPLTVKPSDDVPRELAKVLAECARYKAERDAAREELATLRAAAEAAASSLITEAANARSLHRETLGTRLDGIASRLVNAVNARAEFAGDAP